jgi:two-component system OmpR family sensor kinase
VIANGATDQPAIVVGVLGARPEPRAAIHAAIVAAGATAEALTEATAIAKGAAIGALVLDVGTTPERLLPLAATLANDPRTRHLPRVLVVDGAVPAGRLRRFGPAVIVPEAELAVELSAALAGLVEQVRDRERAIQATHAAVADVRTLEETLAAVQRDGQTLSHDARVLFGVILGFASNLRDGFGGTVTELQHRQLVNIVEASTDAAALLDRYVSALRRLVSASSEPGRISTPRVAARRHVDLGELVKGTVALFQGIAGGKQTELHVSVEAPTYGWCDAMQLKQALVNLVSNALKFTPFGGRVEVVVRPGSPAHERGGSSARRDIEIVVSDDGPGIPPEERERVLERGVRLERDRAVPGTGMGLATVRDIATMHGGLVRIDETPGGGATIALVFPADLRGRSDDHARTKGSSATHRVHPVCVPPSSPRPLELRREPE